MLEQPRPAGPICARHYFFGGGGGGGDGLPSPLGGPWYPALCVGRSAGVTMILPELGRGCGAFLAMRTISYRFLGGGGGGGDGFATLLGGCPVWDSMTFSKLMDGGGGGPLCDAFKLRLPNPGNGSSLFTIRSPHFFWGGGGGGDGFAIFCGGAPPHDSRTCPVPLGGGPFADLNDSLLHELGGRCGTLLHII